MESIRKTIGEIIDSLVTTNLKIFHWMNIETDPTKSEHERFEAGQTVIALNKKRSTLISGIDLLLEGEAGINPKTY